MNKEYAFIGALAALLSKECTVRESLELLKDGANGESVSRAATVVLDSLNKGNYLAEIFGQETVPGSLAVRPYIGMLAETGSILPALQLALADGKRKEEHREKMLEALLYPLCVTGLLTILLVLLFTWGIPWMIRSNLLPDATVVAGMKQGVVLAASFLCCSTGAAAFFSLGLLAKKNRENRFWALLDCLTGAGLTFDQALALSAKSSPVPYTTDGNGWFFDAPELDLYTRSTLHTLRLTGDCRSAFGSIAARKKEALDSLYAVLAGIAEPVLLAITGIVMLILTMTVFLPALTYNGGFI